MPTFKKNDRERFFKTKKTQQYQLSQSSIQQSQQNIEEEDDEDIPADVLQRYEERLLASDGFDVEDLSGYFTWCGTIFPLRLTQYTINEVTPFAEMAISFYNINQNANFEFVEIEKVNRAGSCGPCGATTYYITIQAQNKDTGGTKSFEAQVSEYNSTIEIKFCRLKHIAATLFEGDRRFVGGVEPAYAVPEN